MFGSGFLRLVVTVFVFEVVEPFFSLRLHPNTSLRESACLYGSRAGRFGPDTEYSAATVSHCMAVSIRLTPNPRVESKWHIRLALQARASSRGKGRCNRTSYLRVLPIRFPRGPREPLPSSPSPRPSPHAEDEATAKARRGGPLLSSPSRGFRHYAPTARSFRRGGPPAT